MRLACLFLGVSLAISASCKKEPAAGTGSGSQAGSGSGSGSATPIDAAGSGSDTTPTAGSGSGSDTGSGSAGSGSATGATAGSGGDSELLGTHRAGNCPSMVLGATTTSTLKGKAVIVTIESTDVDAVSAIQKRTDDLLADKAAAPADGTAGGGGHNQKGAHGGGQGLCPVHVPEGAKVVAKHEAKGVIVTITPKDKADELSREVEGRIAKAATWVKANVKDAPQGNQGGVGGGKGDDGSNHSGKGDGKGHQRKQAGSGVKPG